jgi:RHS repeat-associated protein
VVKATSLQIWGRGPAPTDLALPAPPTWSVSLHADETTPAAGQSATLTATANAPVSNTEQSYLQIIDTTAGTIVANCANGATCSTTVSSATAGTHHYRGRISYWQGPDRSGDDWLVGATSDDLPISFDGAPAPTAATTPTPPAWRVTLTADPATRSLTATATRDVSATAYNIDIIDHTNNDSILSSCSIGTLCQASATTTAALGDHDYLARIAAGTEIAATSNTVSMQPTAASPAGAPGSVVLSANAADVPAGGLVTLAAVTDADLATSTSTLTITDQTDGRIVASCMSGTVCAGTVAITDNLAHTYGATVNGLTSATLAVRPQPWSISLSQDRPSFRAGESATLTASANQDITGTAGAPVTVYVFDQTTGQRVAACSPDKPSTYIHDSSRTVCSVPAWFTSGAGHSYIAEVAAANWPATISDATDVRATSTAITLTRAGWTVSLTSNKSVFAQTQDHPWDYDFVLSASANQDVAGTANSYATYIVDNTTNEIIWACLPTFPSEYGHSATHTGCTTQYWSNQIPVGSNDFTAYVAAAIPNYWPTNGASADQLTDIQAHSETVTVSRLNPNFYAFDQIGTDGDVAQLSYTLNQGTVGMPYRSVRIYDYTAGAVVAQGNFCQTTTWNGCALFGLQIPAGEPPHDYVAQIVYTDPHTHQQSIESSSPGLILAGQPLPPTANSADGETTGGSNPAEKNCQRCQGDPVNTASGEFFLPATDIGIPGKGPGLMISRTYSSTSATNDGPLGHGWALNYGTQLSFTGGDATDPNPRLVTVTQDNGSTVQFAEDPSHTYHALPRVMATLTHDGNTGAWTFTRQATQVLTFNAAGRLISEADPNGNSITLSYDASGHLATVAAPGGRSLTLTWTGGHITGVADSASRSVSYSYNSSGDLTKATDVNGNDTSYAYNSSHQLTAATTPRGAATTNSYDPTTGRVISQTDALNRTTTFSYANGQATTTAADGSKTVDTYVNGELMSQTRAAGTSAAATTSYTYDDARNTLTVTDPTGVVTSFSYDNRGNPLSYTDPLHHTTTSTYNELNEVTATTDPLNRHTSYTYDIHGNRLTATTPGGHTQQWTYNNDGTVATTTDADGHTSTHSYNAAGDLTATTDPAGRTVHTAFDAAGHPISHTNNAGQTTTNTVDANGHILTSTDPLGAVTTNTYDPDGNKTSIADPLGHVTHASYDTAEQLATTTDAAGKITSYGYTSTGHLKTVTDPLGHTTTYGYDARGNQTSITNATGETTSFEYDLANRRTKTIAPTGASSTVAYDAAGRTSQTTDANGGITSRAYNAAGQLTASVDPDNRQTSYTYTADGAVETVTNPDSSSTISTYDNSGHATGYTDADGNHTTYSYDDAGLLTSKTARGATTDYTYDTTGRLHQVTQPDGNTETHSYDDAGRLTRIAFSDPATHDIGYAYNSIGQRTSMTDATGTTSYTYDTNGRTATATNGAGLTIHYSYDDAGRLTALGYPGNKTVSYTYDNAGRIIGLTDWKQGATQFSYNPDGRLTLQTDANGTTTSTSFDNGGNTTGITVKSNATTLEAFGYSYDSAGLLRHDTDTTGPSHDYGYSSLNQLTTVATLPPAGTPTTGAYAATPAGQLTGLIDGTTLAYTPTGQLATATPPDGPTTTYGYDANGSRTSATTPATAGAPATTTTYGYTQNGALSTVGTTGTATVTYTSDGDGLRQTRTQTTSTSQFLWDSTTAIPRMLDDGTVSYVYGPSLTPIEQINDLSGSALYLHGDAQHSTRLITDASANIAATSSYDAYGRRTGHTGTVDSAIGYTGQWTDPATGLIYLRARDYDPTTGQFLTTDPAVDTTRQPYSYAGNDPLTFSDPTGLTSIADYITGALTHGATGNLVSLYEGAANGLTGGLVNRAADILSPGASCTIKHNGWYYGGEITGMVAQAAALPLTAELAGLEIAGEAGAAGDATTQIAGDGAGFAAETGDLTTVGRWMSADEHGAMSSTGMVQEGGGGTTYVAHPADPAAYGSQAASGSRYVEFDVPPSSLRPAGKEGWAQIPGPNSLYGRMAQMRGESPPQLPPALNVNWLFTK